MMNTRNLRTLAQWRTAALCVALACGGTVLAAPSWAAPADAGAAHTTMQAKYLNGGIGQDSEDTMRAEAHNWPLRMTFSEHKDGAFVADVKLSVENGAGQQVLQLADAGPMTYVQVPQGKYRITADYKGKQLVREVDVTRAGVSANFNWR